MSLVAGQRPIGPGPLPRFGPPAMVQTQKLDVVSLHWPLQTYHPTAPFVDGKERLRRREDTQGLAGQRPSQTRAIRGGQKLAEAEERGGSGFNWIHLNSMEFHWIQLIRFHWVQLNPTGFSWIHWLQSDSTGFT